jgi:hypothetical protein
MLSSERTQWMCSYTRTIKALPQKFLLCIVKERLLYGCLGKGAELLWRQIESLGSQSIFPRQGCTENSRIIGT